MNEGAMNNNQRASRDSAYLMQQNNLLLHRRGRSLGSVVRDREKERDDDLALFHEMRKREKERNNILFLTAHSDDLESSPIAATKSGGSPVYKMPESPVRKTVADDLLNADGGKNDYDWLLTPPGTPVFPSLEKEMPALVTGPRGTSTVRALPALKPSRLMNHQMEATSMSARSSLISRQTTTSSGSNNSMNTNIKRSSMSTGMGHVPSRPSTPTSRSTVSAPKSMMPTSRSGATASRPSTPTSRTMVPASRSAGTVSRPSTPTARPTLPASRSTVPVSRSTVPASRPSSRPSTPTRRPSTPSSSQISTMPPGRSSSVSKAASIPSRNSAPSRGSSPSVKSRPCPPSSMPDFSLDVPPNLRTTMPERPISATRGRPGAPSAARSTNEASNASGRPRRQSCSPSITRGRISSEMHGSDRSSVQSSKPHRNGNDIMIPGLLGSKMVDKVISARKAAPRQEDQLSTRSTTSTMHSKRPVKPASSPDSTGFGRTLSKKSLDMALRHMDIRRSTPSSLRPLMTNIPTSSLYSVRSGVARSRPASISDSPVATSSNASSEHSVSIALGLGSELDDDDFGSERGSRISPASQQGSIHSKGNLASTNWLHSPGFRDDKYDHDFLYNQELGELSEPSEGFVTSRSVAADCESKLRLQY
ncbi:hypothetical protein SUGI_0843240 [Cryptomeria japonica]|uniref:uncharacterized protein LOC131052616 n=1 Tax=Cryptomeria japonica TaxID=3369 RepID=UPI002414A4D4|nr:uncharacterized protein LOC131052616 [Cryptomeria japonica]GLJ40775.1 hypothetical protein SUGI_0843240 [Cryptomeria japonica]